MIPITSRQGRGNCGAIPTTINTSEEFASPCSEEVQMQNCGATNLHHVHLFSPTVPDLEFPMISFHILGYSNCIHLQIQTTN